MFGFVDMELFYGASRRARTQKKKRKAKPSNWYETCTVDELKQLCRATKLAVSGTKDQLCKRLLDYEQCNQGTVAAMPTGNLNWLKAECRKKGLVISGKRFDLILRLLQQANGTGQPKRAAGSFDDNGLFQPKKRAKIMTLPNVKAIKERAYKKAHPPDEVKWKWSNWTHKQHCSRCIELASQIIQKEVLEKELFETGHEDIAWQVVHAVLQYILYEDQEKIDEYYRQQQGGTFIMIAPEYKPTGMGYAENDLRNGLFPKLIQCIQMTSSKEKLDTLAGKLLRDLERQACIRDDAFSNLLDEKLGEPKKAKTKSSAGALKLYSMAVLNDGSAPKIEPFKPRL